MNQNCTKKHSISYRNISKEVVDAWNEFMDVENMQLKYNSDCSCTKNPVA